jgi:hypothetical protein
MRVLAGSTLILMEEVSWRQAHRSGMTRPPPCRRAGGRKRWGG